MKLKNLLSILNSPLKRPKLWFYFGEPHVGVPYIIPKKAGFKYCNLGYKLKWDDFRFEWSPTYSLILFGKQLVMRIESPIDFGDVYWETWLEYYYNTKEASLDKTKEARFDALIRTHSNTWITYIGDKQCPKDYYLDILKPKWLKRYVDYIEKNPRKTEGNA